MDRIDLNEFKETDDYLSLSDKSKQVIANLLLEGMTVSELYFIRDFLLLDKGEITKEEYIDMAIAQATD